MSKEAADVYPKDVHDFMAQGSALLGFEQLTKRSESGAAGLKFRWHPTVEFVLVLALLGDALVIFGASAFGFWLRFDSGLIPLYSNVKLAPTFLDYFRLLLMGTVFLLGTFVHLELYSERCLMRYFRTARVVVEGTIFWLFMYLAVSLILKFDPPISRLFMLTTVVCTLSAVLAWRIVFFECMHWKVFAINFQQRVLFVGWCKEAEQLEKEIQNDSNHPFKIIGCLSSPQSKTSRGSPPSVRDFGHYHYHKLSNLLEQGCADTVILADPYIKMGEIVGLANQCAREFVQFKVIPSYFHILASGLRLETLGGVPVLGVSDLALNRFSNRLVKRAIDVLGAIIGLLVSAPLIAIFGWLVYRESPGSIFYRQKRMGKNGRVFWLWKIRSMRINAEEKGAQWATEHDPRRLRVGAFMRKWNIDEVPQFFNVLKGDMSLVGPRPERPELISNFKHQIPHYQARHSCLPGLTGWAQVNGWRGNTSLDERIRFDIWYVENWSVGLDFRIMMMTFLQQKNAY
jgi:exopolysaccharide biosynthesis polyprenyl glycosylphosphotransferase